MKPWPKLWHNLRSSRQTELEAVHPTHVVCAWLGNSPAVARAHYLQVRESDFEMATAPAQRCDAESGAQAAQNPTQHAAAPTRNESQTESQVFEGSGFTRDDAKPCDSVRVEKVTPMGFEPMSHP